MSYGWHNCKKPKTDPTYNKNWSGFSDAPHSKYKCPDCGYVLHNENENYYCPHCDDYKSINIDFKTLDK